MEHDWKAFEARIEAILPTLATKADIEAVRADMLKISSDTQKWMLASILAMFVGFGGLYFATSDSSRGAARVQQISSAPVQSLQPIVIYLPPEVLRPPEKAQK